MTRKHYEKLVKHKGKFVKESKLKRNSLVKKALTLTVASAIALTIASVTKNEIDVFDMYKQAKQKSIEAIQKAPSFEEIGNLRAEYEKKKDYPSLEKLVEKRTKELNSYTKDEWGKWFSEVSAYRDYIQEAANKTGFDENFFNALFAWEGQGDLKAYSPKGASGPAQLMPEIARNLGLRVDDIIDERMNPEKAFPAAAKLISDSKKRWNEDLMFVLTDYNLGHKGLKKRLNKEGEIVSLPNQTKKHMASVGAMYELLEDGFFYEKKHLFSEALDNTFIHKLKLGENLTALSRKYDSVSVDDIKFVNPEIINYNKVNAGMNIRIPNHSNLASNYR